MSMRDWVSGAVSAPGKVTMEPRSMEFDDTPEGRETLRGFLISNPDTHWSPVFVHRCACPFHAAVHIPCEDPVACDTCGCCRTCCEHNAECEPTAPVCTARAARELAEAWR